MKANNSLKFEIYVMDLCDDEGCKTAMDYERVSEELHERLENAIQGMCMYNGIEDYEPCY